MTKNLIITEMFMEMIKQGHITPVVVTENMEELRFPGELPYIPTIATYGTTQVLTSVGGAPYAELEQRT